MISHVFTGWGLAVIFSVIGYIIKINTVGKEIEKCFIGNFGIDGIKLLFF